ncbi:uncharacterized protein LOC135500819 [Lineus longissimus]|uniref:uncharacterized protein LOC135500819 n=1 Tax=Lineus longissimus TaxID=88925 RepID=UPI00315DCFEA
MASKAADSAKVCLVCFETRPLKIAGRCKHSFCTECLTNAIQRHDGDVFSCPSCHADCPRPWNGVEGLVGYTGEEVAAEDLGFMVEQDRKEKGVNAPRHEKRDGGKFQPAVLDVRCMICQHKKREVQAVNLCVECKNLYICGDCTEVHGKNKATKGHSVIPLQLERPKQEAVCVKHNSPLDSYCTECKQAVCMVCVMLEHGDHTLEKIGEIVDAKVEGLKVVLKEREERLGKLQMVEKELVFLTRIAPVVDKQDILIKEIEDHAQKCIEKIVKWKEDLKEKVKADYLIIHDIPVCLKKVSETVQKMQAPIQRAGQLLSETEHQPVYLDRLIALQQDLEALAETGNNVQGEGYTAELRELHNQDCRFMPEAIDSLGKIDKTQARQEEDELEIIYKDTMVEDDKEKFIPCVANLGQRFAVAHPTTEGEPSNAVDIYQFPGELKHTFKDHVPPLYDVSATPDGKLAMLSDGTGDTSRCVKLFDSQTGYISSTCDFDIAKPLSLGVTLQHQYVILGDNEHGERQITVVDKEGCVEHTHVIDEEIHKKLIEPSRITCGGKCNFVIGKLCAHAFEISDTGIHGLSWVITCAHPDDIKSFDISASMWDDLSVAGNYKKMFVLQILEMNEGKLSPTWRHKTLNLDMASVADREETRVSIRDSHIVMSKGRTIRVCKIYQGRSN